MLPFGVRYTSKQHHFSSDDEDDDKTTTNKKRNLVEMLNDSSSTSVDKLITKNKNRKEREIQDEREFKVQQKKQKIEK